MALSRGFWISQVLFTGVELGVFDALAARPLTPAAAARRLRISPRGADILLHALAALNTEDGNTYAGEEIRAWLRAAGFRELRRVPLGDHSTAIVARKPRN